MEREAIAEHVMRHPFDAGRNRARRRVQPRSQEHGPDEPEVDLLGTDLIRREVDVGDAKGLSLALFESVALRDVEFGTRPLGLPLHVAQALTRRVGLGMVLGDEIRERPRSGRDARA